MPIYEYICDNCGLQFEMLKGISQSDESEKCPECDAVAQKVPSAVNHSFAHTPTGPVPQNTGVHAIDYNADRVIGADAERRWATIEERQKHKEGVLQDAAKQGIGADMQHLVRTREGAGDYRVITEPERIEVNKRRLAAEAVNKAVAKQNETPPKGS
jgi:putative FmdB family regulatory protein